MTPLCLSQRPSCLQVLAESIAEHFRAVRLLQRRVDARRALIGGDECAFGAGVDLDSQQATLDSAVPNRVDAVCAQTQLEPEIGRAGEDDGLPAFEVSLQYFAELAMKGAGFVVVFETHAIRRVDAKKTRWRWRGGWRRRRDPSCGAEFAS